MLLTLLARVYAQRFPKRTKYREVNEQADIFTRNFFNKTIARNIPVSRIFLIIETSICARRGTDARRGVEKIKSVLTNFCHLQYLPQTCFRNGSLHNLFARKQPRGHITCPFGHVRCVDDRENNHRTT